MNKTHVTYLLLASLALLLAACPKADSAPSAGADAAVEAGHEGHDHAVGAGHGDAAAGSAEQHTADDGHDHAGEEHSGDEHGGDEPGHDAHAGHEGEAAGGGDAHDHAELITLTPEQLKQHGVKLQTAAGGKLAVTLTLPGEAALNADAVGHVLPKLAGVVQKVTKNIGDNVRKGELLAVIDSRELAQVKADYLAARERLSTAQATAQRERQLVEQGVSPELDLIQAQNAVRELEIQVRAAEQSLHALGVSEEQLEALAAAPHQVLTRYEVYAPISGRILEKHVAVGEMVDNSSELFLIADLSTVWVNLNVSQRDLPRVMEGQSVLIRFSPATDGAPTQAAVPPAIPDATGKIKFIDALIAEDTRKAAVRIVLSNPQGRWKPGMFVTGHITIDKADAAVLVPLASLIEYEGQQTLFVQDEHGFVPRAVALGRQSATHAEVLSGLQRGERFVVTGAYMVKAELGKSEAGHGH